MSIKGKQWKKQWKQFRRFVCINNKYNRIMKKVEKNPSHFLSNREIKIIVECESDYMSTIRKVMDLSDMSPKKYEDDHPQTIDDCMHIREIYNKALTHMLDLNSVGGHNIRRTYEYWKMLLDSYGLDSCFPKKDKDESKDKNKDNGVSTDE